jgi:hypothetical protein
MELHRGRYEKSVAMELHMRKKYDKGIALKINKYGNCKRIV